MHLPRPVAEVLQPSHLLKTNFERLERKGSRLAGKHCPQPCLSRSWRLDQESERGNNWDLQSANPGVAHQS
ncbi:hypothetical protein MRX96_035223 [Rhipicephalus microplus]